MNKIIEIIKKKWLKDTFLTILLIAIIFAVYYLMNFGVEKLNIENLDLTTDKMYSITETTRTKLKDLNKEVKILLINFSDKTKVVDYCKKYTQLSSKIKVEEIADLSERADIMQEYKLQSTDSLILVESEGRKTELAEYDLTTYDYTTYDEIDITEEAITNAIIEVTIEEKPKIYFLAGHNQYNDQYFMLLREELEAEANEIGDINILTAGSISEDCKCLIITTLKEDITEMEKDKILEYSNNGGKILLLTDANLLGIETPNFNAVLDAYGFSISKGIVMEQDTERMVYNSPEFVIAPVESVINQNINMNMNICVIDSGNIEFKDEEILSNLGVTYTPIAVTSDTSFLRTNLNIVSGAKTNQDEDAPNSIVGALVTRDLENEKTAEMIVYSNTVFATNQQINMGNGYGIYANKLFNNDDVTINSVSYLTQRKDTITIRKNSDTVSYTVTDAQHTTIMAILFSVPAIIIIVGIIVWQIRRRKK